MMDLHTLAEEAGFDVDEYRSGGLPWTVRVRGNRMLLDQQALARFAGLVRKAALQEERGMWHELVGQLVACHEDETCPAVAWAKNVLSDTDAQFAEWLADKEA